MPVSAGFFFGLYWLFAFFSDLFSGLFLKERTSLLKGPAPACASASAAHRPVRTSHCTYQPLLLTGKGPIAMMILLSVRNQQHH